MVHIKKIFKKNINNDLKYLGCLTMFMMYFRLLDGQRPQDEQIKPLRRLHCGIKKWKRVMLST